MTRTRTHIRDWVTLISLMVGTGILYFWNLTASGWANSFYSAAVQAGTKSWVAFFYGSFDASNAITVDKPPAALWLMELSARVFGLSSFSILLPEVLLGVASVALLFWSLRRSHGWFAGFTAALVFALTPVAALMFRFNNPDALLTFLMLASVLTTFRLSRTGHTRWALVVGVLLGFAFLTKSFQAFLILPALGLGYLLFGQPKLGRRFLHLGVALVSMIVAGGWWVAVVELVPASMRPYIGGSQTNSALELILGYNGLGRLTGNETGSVGGGGNSGGNWGITGIQRLFVDEYGGQIAWLLPLALLAIVICVIAYFRQRRTSSHLFEVSVWGLALLSTWLTFSFMAGIFHQYYTVALVPYIAALVGILAGLVWARRHTLWVRIVASVGVLGSGIWAAFILTRNSEQGWLVAVVPLVAILAAAGIQLLHVERRWLQGVVGALTLTALLAGPSYYTLYTVATGHSGSIVTAGPSVQGSGMGGGMRGGAGGEGPGGMGGPGGSTSQGATGMQGQTQGGPGAAMGTQTGTATQGQQGPGGMGGESNMGGGVGGLLNASTPSASLTKLLQTNASAYKWVLATTGSQSAAGYQLASGEAVMSIGGFNGTDPFPSLAYFKQLITKGQIHYYIASSGMGMGGGSSNSDASQISAWVKANFTTVTVGGVTLYDLTSPV